MYLDHVFMHFSAAVGIFNSIQSFSCSLSSGSWGFKNTTKYHNMMGMIVRTGNTRDDSTGVDYWSIVDE